MPSEFHNKKPQRKRRIGPREKAAMATDLRWRFVRDVMSSRACPGDLLPSLNDIMRRYGVTFAVARDLYQRLKEEGYVEPAKGAGVFLKTEFTESAKDSGGLRGLNLGVVAFIQYENPRHAYTRANAALHAFERKSALYGGRTRLYNIHPVHNITLDHLEEIKKESPDGLLFMPPYPEDADENIRKLMMLDIPLVAVHKTNRTHSILFDNRQAAMDITRFVLDQGYDRVGFIQKGMDDYWAKERFEGISSVFAEKGRAMDRRLIFDVKNEPFTKEFSCELDVLFKKVSKTERTAFICSGEPYAANLLDVALKNGWNVPDKFGVASIGDHWATRHLHLTSVQMSDYELGLAGHDLLVQVIKNKPAEMIERRVSCPLLVRQTIRVNPVNGSKAGWAA